MKYVKMLGLAAVAAMALMALLGAGSASATVLCEVEKTSGCFNEDPEKDQSYPAGTVVHATLKKGTTATLEGAGIVLDTCTTSTLKGTTSTTGSSTETVKGTNEVLTWGEKPSTECTKTTNTVNAGSLEIHWISGSDNGTLTATGAEVTINTVFGSCVYGSGTALDLGTLVGGAEPSITIDATVPKITGNGLCPSTGTWKAEYVVTSPTPLYVSTS